jgi:hypothetical protein
LNVTPNGDDLEGWRRTSPCGRSEAGHPNAHLQLHFKLGLVNIAKGVLDLYPVANAISFD